jgi:hypothetical protein
MEHREAVVTDSHDRLRMNTDCIQPTDDRDDTSMHTNAIIHVLTTFGDMTHDHDDDDGLHKLLRMAKFSDDELASAEHILTQIVLNNDVVCGGCQIIHVLIFNFQQSATTCH